MGLDQITLDMLGRANRAILRQESATLLLTGKNKVGAALVLRPPCHGKSRKLVKSHTEPVSLTLPLQVVPHVTRFHRIFCVAL